ncbi:MAG: methyl-accepting chemotaxis protein [Spirochaetales bacterium]|nr:methyl-accepting chemotaxis protein [Spirochaetales bacterium]
MKIKNLALKMQIALDILMVSLLIPIALIIYFPLHAAKDKHSTEELIVNTELIRKAINLYVDSSVKNYLHAISEKGEKLLNHFYNLSRQGILTEEEAMEDAAGVFLDPEIGRIGSTGYLAGVNGQGIFVMHPKSPGYDGSGSEVVQNALKQKRGYYEYMWANAGEETEQEKSAYLSYFSPWDILIFASSYKDEFFNLIDKEDLLAILRDFRIGEKGYTIVLDGKGNIVYHPEIPSGNVLSNKSGEPENNSLRDLVLQSSLRPGQILSGVYTGLSDRLERKCTVIYDPKLDWFILTSIPVGELFATVYRIRTILVAGLIVAFLAMNIVISLLFRIFLAPLREVNRVASLASKGDISHSINVKTEDEIGGIAIQVNSIMDKMAEIVKRLRIDVGTIDGSIQDLSSSSSQVSATSNEQASAVKEIVTTMEDSDSLTKGIEKRISEVAQISERTREVVVSGVSNVEASLAKMEEIRVSNNDTISGIRSLGEKIEAIWDIVNIINSIADQTKIIAFNAELEASAAGEAGKNFQIVASEIRRLADSTVNSTSEIKNKINEIQHSSDRLITSSEDGTNKIEEGGKLTEALHSTFSQIRETAEISADSAREITEAVRQQVMAFEQILLTLKQISGGINSFVVSTKATNEISMALKMMSDNIAKFLDTFKTKGDLIEIKQSGTTGKECPMIGGCAFFNDKMGNMPAAANMFKQNYCRGNFADCARYIVKQATGVAHPTLMPNQGEDVGKIIQELSGSPAVKEEIVSEECPLVGGCAFFNDKMGNMPIAADRFKQNYCRGNFRSCARYRVKQATGVAHKTLMPNQDDAVEETIREINAAK